MAKFIQVNQWDRKYEKADKIVVNTEQIVQVNPAATDHRAIILTVRGEFTGRPVLRSDMLRWMRR